MSKRITSAPNCRRCWQQSGAATKAAPSTTRMPSSNAYISVPSGAGRRVNRIRLSLAVARHVHVHGIPITLPVCRLFLIGAPMATLNNPKAVIPRFGLSAPESLRDQVRATMLGAIAPGHMAGDGSRRAVGTVTSKTDMTKSPVSRLSRVR
jgi:hypothetical protein